MIAMIRNIPKAAGFCIASYLAACALKRALCCWRHIKAKGGINYLVECACYEVIRQVIFILSVRIAVSWPWPQHHAEGQRRMHYFLWFPSNFFSAQGHLYELQCRPKRIFVIRHGESEGNIDKSLFQTKPDNQHSLTENGVEQARQVRIPPTNIQATYLSSAHCSPPLLLCFRNQCLCADKKNVVYLQMARA
jgi:hypothetical protein